MKVLLADDAAEMRALLRWTLEQQPVDGVEIVGEAVDGDEALRMAVELLPDVIVLDLQMPGPAPGELLRAMRDQAPQVPVVTFSGFEPDLIVPDEARLVARHIPKTTDLAIVRTSILEVARGLR